MWPTEGGVETVILLSKVRLTPLHGGSVPCHELKAMVILLRIAIIAARAVSFKPKRITLSTDSASFVATLKNIGASLNPLFANRVAEIQHTRAELSKLA